MPEINVKTKIPKTNRIKLENVRAKNRKTEELEPVEKIRSLTDDGDLPPEAYELFERYRKALGCDE